MMHHTVLESRVDVGCPPTDAGRRSGEGRGEWYRRAAAAAAAAAAAVARRLPVGGKPKGRWDVGTSGRKGDEQLPIWLADYITTPSPPERNIQDMSYLEGSRDRKTRVCEFAIDLYIC